MRGMLLAIILVWHASMAAAQSDRHPSFSWDKLVAPIRAKLPPGPMSSWTPEQRSTANRALYACAMMGMMSTGNGGGSPTEVRLQASYMSLTCEYHAAPKDWPGRAGLADKIRQEYADLKQARPDTPDPQLDP